MPEPHATTGDASLDPLRHEVVVGDTTVHVISFPAGAPASGHRLQAVANQLPANGPCHVLLDLDAVEQVQGPFFGELLKLMKRLRGSGGSLKLCRLQGAIHDVLRVTRMEKLFEVYADRDAALTTLGATPPPSADPAAPGTPSG